MGHIHFFSVSRLISASASEGSWRLCMRLREFCCCLCQSVIMFWNEDKDENDFSAAAAADDDSDLMMMLKPLGDTKDTGQSIGLFWESFDYTMLMLMFGNWGKRSVIWFFDSSFFSVVQQLKTPRSGECWTWWTSCLKSTLRSERVHVDADRLNIKTIKLFM